MFEGLTAWHERNPLLDAFCEGMDEPSPRSTFELGGPASAAGAPARGERAVSPADPESEPLPWR